jgi:hypothetical protein
MIYKGVTFNCPDNTIVPDIHGILITKDGRYDGEFKRGKAKGKGIYISEGSPRVRYKGEWDNGMLVKGYIETDEFRFKGILINRIPEGDGKILFKKTKTVYKGNFKHGKYHSEKFKAVYVSKDY